MKTKVKRTTSVLLTILMLAMIPLATARAADASIMQVTSTWDKEKERYIDSMEYDFFWTKRP